MSGATAAHASYNGSGTQGIAVTNKLNDTGDITSVFWNKDNNTKQLLHGASLIEIPASGSGAAPGGTFTFTLNSDMDAIGDMYVIATLTVPAGGTLAIRKEYGLLSMINRVEFHCGTQIWQTLEGDDIIALNSTELSEGAYEKFVLSSAGYITDTSFNRDFSAVSLGNAAVNRVLSFKVPLLTRNLAPMFNNYSNIREDGFLTAAAPNQTIKVRIFTNTVQDMSSNFNVTTNTSPTLDLRLFGTHLVMCNEEREKIRNMPGGLAKRVKITQNATISSFPLPKSGITTATIDCDHFSLYASHLIIQITDASVFKDAQMGETPSATANNYCSIVDADLRLNSTSYCGKVTGALMTGPLAETIGLYVNCFFSRSVAGVRTFSYVFPLANFAYSGSGVPLNRFDNIRLVLRIAYDNPNVAVTDELLKISVTCVGESTALYKQGAASISMY
jgi:hypothetical protein